MKKLILISLSSLVVGCSSVPKQEKATIYIPSIPKCDIQLMSGTTYWSRIENGSIYLFIGQRKTKCLLRKL
jgi:hypothetical protein